MMRRARLSALVLPAWTSIVAVFVLGPLFMVLVVSLTTHDYLSLPDEGLSLRWYASLLERRDFGAAALRSLWLAAGSSSIALVLGLAASIALIRNDLPATRMLRTLLMTPLFVPMVLSGLAILSVYSTYGWSDQMSRLFVAHTALTLPYVIRTLSASLASIDVRQELAARNLGAGPWQTFFRVTLPQLGPGLFAGGLFAFIVSFDNVGLSLFLAGPGSSTLPVELFSYASFNSDPVVAAVSVTMVVLSIGTVIVVERLLGLEKLMR